MSLGLRDLDRPRTSSQKKDTKPKESVAVTSMRSYTARPWSDSDLAAKTSGRRRPVNADAAMNEDWINLHSAPLYWFDLGADSRFAAVQNRLVELEECVGGLVERARSLLRQFGVRA